MIDIQLFNTISVTTVMSSLRYIKRYLAAELCEIKTLEKCQEKNNEVFLCLPPPNCKSCVLLGSTWYAVYFIEVFCLLSPGNMYNGYVTVAPHCGVIGQRH